MNVKYCISQKLQILILAFTSITIIGCASTKALGSSRTNYLRDELKYVCVTSHTFKTADTIQLREFTARRIVKIANSNMDYEIYYDIESYKREKIIGVYCGNVRDTLDIVIKQIEKLSNSTDSIIEVNQENNITHRFDALLDQSAIIRLAVNGQIMVKRVSDSVVLKSVIVQPWEDRCGDLCGGGGMAIFDENQLIIRHQEWIS